MVHLMSTNKSNMITATIEFDDWSIAYQYSTAKGFNSSIVDVKVPLTFKHALHDPHVL